MIVNVIFEARYKFYLLIESFYLQIWKAHVPWTASTGRWKFIFRTCPMPFCLCLLPQLQIAWINQWDNEYSILVSSNRRPFKRILPRSASSFLKPRALRTSLQLKTSLGRSQRQIIPEPARSSTKRSLPWKSWQGSRFPVKRLPPSRNFCLKPIRGTKFRPKFWLKSGQKPSSVRPAATTKCWI